MKKYRTFIPAWSKTRGEYKKATETPEILTSYSFYGRIETYAAPLVLFAIGGNEKDDFTTNWDIYADKNGNLYSIPRQGSTAQGTYYGGKHHIAQLIKEGTFRDTLTDYGREIMNA